MADDSDGQWWADPYALGISEVYGERVAHGHPETTDDDRAAAGRPTLAATRDDLERENAVARAARGIDAELGDDPALVISDTALPVEVLASRLAVDSFAAWADGDIAHIAWRGQADHVEVIGSLNVALHARGDDLWSVSMKVRDLAAARWDLQVLAAPGGRGVIAHFVGANAGPPDGLGAPVACDRTLITDAGNATITVYASPDRVRELLVLIGDGEDVPALAAALAPCVEAGVLPGVVLAGVHSVGQDARAARLLPGTDPLTYSAQRVALFDVIVPALRAEYDVAGSVVLAGFSAGAAWALDTAVAEATVIGAYAFAPTPYGFPVAAQVPPIVLGYGTLDPFAAPAAVAIADQLTSLGATPITRTVVTGHDWNAYVRGFPDALTDVLAASG